MLDDLKKFQNSISHAVTQNDAYDALLGYTETTVGVKLFTVMTVDMENDLACRAYSNMPKSYPVSGTKPIVRDSWFKIVHDDHDVFVANTIEDIANVFPDYDLIKSLGCESVLNLPVVVKGELLATINLLHEANYFTPKRVDMAKELIALPAMSAILIANQLEN